MAAIALTADAGTLDGGYGRLVATGPNAAIWEDDVQARIGYP